MLVLLQAVKPKDASEPYLVHRIAQSLSVPEALQAKIYEGETVTLPIPELKLDR